MTDIADMINESSYQLNDNFFESMSNDDDSSSIHIAICKLMQAWQAECSAPELLASIFMTSHGELLSNALHQTDTAVQAMKPEVSVYSRLSLCLSERATIRICHAVRMFKARRRLKLLSDPIVSLLWHEAVDGDYENPPLDYEEHTHAVNMRHTMNSMKVLTPLLSSHPTFVNAIVDSPDMNNHHLIEPVAADPQLSRVFGEMFPAPVLSTEKIKIPQGTILSVEYSVIQDLVHEGYMVTV